MSQNTNNNLTSSTTCGTFTDTIDEDKSCEKESKYNFFSSSSENSILKPKPNQNSSQMNIDDSVNKDKSTRKSSGSLLLYPNREITQNLNYDNLSSTIYPVFQNEKIDKFDKLIKKFNNQKLLVKELPNHKTQKTPKFDNRISDLEPINKPNRLLDQQAPKTQKLKKFSVGENSLLQDYCHGFKDTCIQAIKVAQNFQGGKLGLKTNLKEIVDGNFLDCGSDHRIYDTYRMVIDQLGFEESQKYFQPVENLAKMKSTLVSQSKIFVIDNEANSSGQDSVCTKAQNQVYFAKDSQNFDKIIDNVFEGVFSENDIKNIIIHQKDNGFDAIQQQKIDNGNYGEVFIKNFKSKYIEETQYISNQEYLGMKHAESMLKDMIYNTKILEFGDDIHCDKLIEYIVNLIVKFEGLEQSQSKQEQPNPIPVSSKQNFTQTASGNHNENIKKTVSQKLNDTDNQNELNDKNQLKQSHNSNTKNSNGFIGKICKCFASTKKT